MVTFRRRVKEATYLFIFIYFTITTSSPNPFVGCYYITQDIAVAVDGVTVT